MVEEEQRGRDDARDAAARAERRAAELNAELEDIRNQLEQVFNKICGNERLNWVWSVGVIQGTVSVNQ